MPVTGYSSLSSVHKCTHDQTQRHLWSNHCSFVESTISNMGARHNFKNHECLCRHEVNNFFFSLSDGAWGYTLGRGCGLPGVMGEADWGEPSWNKRSFSGYFLSQCLQPATTAPPSASAELHLPQRKLPNGGRCSFGVPFFKSCSPLSLRWEKLQVLQVQPNGLLCATFASHACSHPRAACACDAADPSCCFSV